MTFLTDLDALFTEQRATAATWKPVAMATWRGSPATAEPGWPGESTRPAERERGYAPRGARDYSETVCFTRPRRRSSATHIPTHPMWSRNTWSESGCLLN